MHETSSQDAITSLHDLSAVDLIAGYKAGQFSPSEVMEALRHGAPTEGVELPAPDSLRDEVSYAVGALENARHRENANRYLAFLATPAAQDAYASFGFVKAQPAELTLKPID